LNNKTFLRHIKNQQNHWWFQSRKKILHQIISGINLKRFIYSLDFGSGSGVNIDMLQKYGNVDIHEKNKVARLNIKKNYNIKKIYKSLNFKKGYYDLILIADVLEHVEKPEKLLIILKKSLKKNGHILITVPAYQFLFSNKDITLKHYRRYELKTLKKIISNFKIIKISYSNTLLFIPLAILILINKTLKRDFINDAETTTHFIINKLLYYIFSCESFLLRFFKFPFGMSIYTLVKKC
jgi:2-polyprenyl-3-methyl-5-hydroxy-6-metoxy-1,4-benzoquinol methylase